MDITAISWTDHTHNYVHGCTHADADDPADPEGDVEATSAECDHCYAETTDKRFGGDHWGDSAPRRILSDAYWLKPMTWNAAAERDGRRHRVFCSSMADVFETHRVPEIQAILDSQRKRLWDSIAKTPWLDWQLLTKRPENFRRYLPWSDMDASGKIAAEWQEPWPNVWLGVTIGTRRSLWRARYLRQTPAVVRFVSGEPLLDHISAAEWDVVLGTPGVPRPVILTECVPVLGQYADHENAHRIHWLIIGDESGHGRRPCHPDWVRTARDAAERHGVAWHFKQWNGSMSDGIDHPDGKVNHKNNKVHLPLLDGRRHDAMPQGIPVLQRDPVDR